MLNRLLARAPRAALRHTSLALGRAARPHFAAQAARSCCSSSSSSFSSSSSPATRSHSERSPDDKSASQPLGKITGTYLISFTCKHCLARTTRTFSKQAYHTGVVIVNCTSCARKHLIADHLGYFDSQRRVGAIEDFSTEQIRKDWSVVSDDERVEIIKAVDGLPKA